MWQVAEIKRNENNININFTITSDKSCELLAFVQIL